MEPLSVESTLPDPVCQFSIFTENKVGRLADLTRLFGQREIHILALNTLDTTDSAILRVIAVFLISILMMLQVIAQPLPYRNLKTLLLFLLTKGQLIFLTSH